MPMVCLLVAAGSGFAQHQVDPTNMYARAYAITPMIGSGTWDDPRRPMFAPVPQTITPNSRTGIIAFHYVESDDGRFGLIEIVAASQAQLASITGPLKAQVSAVPGLQFFDRNTTPITAVQAAFQSMRKNFDISQFFVVVP